MSSVRGAHGPLSSPFARLVLAIACVVLLAAFSRPVDLPRTRTSDELSYAFTDARPKKQFKTGWESRLIFACDYGSERIGDKDFTPSLAVLLNDALMARLAEPLSGRKVTLHNFTVHFNDARALRESMTSTYAMTGGLAAVADAVMNDNSVLGCAPADYLGGYVANEIPAEVLTPWVLAVEVEIDGQRFQARHVMPAHPHIQKVYDGTWAETKLYWKRLRGEDLAPGLQVLLGKLTDQIAVAYAPAPPAGEVAAPVAAEAAVPAAAPAAAPAEVTAPAEAPAAPPSP